MHYDALPILETQRLFLRPIILDDAPDIFEYAKNPKTSQLLHWYPSTSIEETKAIIQKWLENYKQDKQAPWVIVDKKSNKIIGTIELRVREDEKELLFKSRKYLGYCLSPDYWGKGLMPEALTAIIDYVFTNTQITELRTFVRPDNPASQRVLEKTGFALEKPDAKREMVKDKLVIFDRWVLQKQQ